MIERKRACRFSRSIVVAFVGMLRAGPRGDKFWHRIEKRPRCRRNGGFEFRREYTRAWCSVQKRRRVAAQKRWTFFGSPAGDERSAAIVASLSARLLARMQADYCERAPIVPERCSLVSRQDTSVFRGNRRRVFRGTMQNPTALTDKDRNIAHCSKTQ